MRHTGKSGGTDTVEVRLGDLPAAVDRVALAASADGGTFGQVPGLRVTVTDLATGAELASFAMSATDETAFVSGELYRRGGSWKFRAVGQGWASGLAGPRHRLRHLGCRRRAGRGAAPCSPGPGAATTPAIGATAADRRPPPPAAAAMRPGRPHHRRHHRPARVMRPGRPPPPTAPPPPASAGFATGPTPAPPPPPTLDAGRVSLVKGSRVSLVKYAALRLWPTVTMGLGWDPAPGRKRIDLDASAIGFDAGGRKLAIVWFTHLSDFNGALRHGGDNLTGQGEGDDEQIHVDLQRMPPAVTSIVFTITSFGGQKFTDVARAFCRLVDASTGQELVRYDLSNAEPRSAVVMAMLRRTSAGSWEMRAIGEFHDARTVKKLVDPGGEVGGRALSPDTAFGKRSPTALRTALKGSSALRPGRAVRRDDAGAARPQPSIPR